MPAGIWLWTKRSYLVLTTAGWVVLACYSYFRSTGILVWVVAVAAFVPSALLLTSLGFLRTPYSAIGRCRRRRFPEGPPLLQTGTLVGESYPRSNVGMLLQVSVFPAGLGLRILWLWKVFLPWSSITEFDVKSGWTGTRVTLRTDSPELRCGIRWWMNRSRVARSLLALVREFTDASETSTER